MLTPHLRQQHHYKIMSTFCDYFAKINNASGIARSYPSAEYAQFLVYRIKYMQEKYFSFLNLTCSTETCMCELLKDTASFV